MCVCVYMHTCGGREQLGVVGYLLSMWVWGRDMRLVVSKCLFIGAPDLLFLVLGF